MKVLMENGITLDIKSTKDSLVYLVLSAAGRGLPAEDVLLVEVPVQDAVLQPRLHRPHLRAERRDDLLSQLPPAGLSHREREVLPENVLLIIRSETENS